jgi:hypothetical protein
MSQDGSEIRLPITELLGLNSGKRATFYLPITPFPSFHPSSYLLVVPTGGVLNGGSLKLIIYISFATRHTKRGTLVSTVPTQSYGWFIYRQTLLYTPFPFRIWDMKTHEEDNVKFHIFLTLAVGGSEYSDSHPGCFTPVESFTGSHCIAGCVGPRTGLDSLMPRKIFFSCRQSNACPLITLHSILKLFSFIGNKGFS